MTRKADLKTALAPLVTEICMDRVFPKVVFTEPSSGRKPAVTVEELSEAMEQLGVGYIPTEAEKNPMKAFEIAGSMAREENVELLVIGSVYLVGDLLEYVVERDGLDLWEVLTAH
jgi:folylpolyglutamate synthase/dihydropteroate synthase